MDGNQNLTLSLHSLHPVTYLTCLSTPCLSTCEAHSVLQRKEWKHVSPRMAVGTKGSVVRTHQQQTGRERWIDRHRERERQRGQKTGRGRRQLTVATCGSCDTRGPDGLTDCVRAVCRSVLVTIIAHNPPPRCSWSYYLDSRSWGRRYWWCWSSGWRRTETTQLDRNRKLLVPVVYCCLPPFKFTSKQQWCHPAGTVTLNWYLHPVIVGM